MKIRDLNTSEQAGLKSSDFIYKKWYNKVCTIHLKHMSTLNAVCQEHFKMGNLLHKSSQMFTSVSYSFKNLLLYPSYT